MEINEEDDEVIVNKTKNKKKKKPVIDDTDEPDPFGPVDEMATPLPPAAKEARRLAEEKKKRNAKEDGEEEVLAPKTKKARTATTIVPVSVTEVEPLTAQTGEYEFVIVLQEPLSLSKLTNILSNLTEDVTLVITAARKPGDFQGIKVNQYVCSRQCFVSTAFAVQVADLQPGSESVYVSIKLSDFANSIKAIPAGSTTKIMKRTKSDFVEIEAFNSTTKKILRVKMRPIVTTEPENNSVEDASFSHSIEMQLGDLDRICRYIHLLGAPSIAFTLLKDPRKNDIYLQISGDGEQVTYSEYFPCSIGTSGVIRVNASTKIDSFAMEDDEDEGKPTESALLTDADLEKFTVHMPRNMYVTKNLTMFLKGLEKSNITLSFIPGRVMCMQYQLTNTFCMSTDTVKYLVACRVEDNADDATA